MGLTVIGSILFIIGILMVTFFWPVLGFETKDTYNIEDVKGGETVRYAGSLTNITEVGGIYVLELDDGAVEVYTKNKDFNLNDHVLVTIIFGNNASNWDENQYHVQRIPTTGGYLGLIVVILGLSIAIAGLVSKKSTLEDILHFNVHHKVQPSRLSTASHGTELQPQTLNVEQVTCPKCGYVFGVKGLLRPARISCPKCGLEGILD